MSNHFKIKNKAFRLSRSSTLEAAKVSLNKDEALKATEKLSEELQELQSVLYAEHKHKVLVILQGMDAAGKDGTIRQVFKVFDPQGVSVVSYKAPDSKEKDYDFLWRIHRETPPKGKVVIFNRSHYEDFLVPNVYALLDKKNLDARLQHINDFERMLSDEGTLILKFFLHISKAEQQERLTKRLKDPQKNWKFNPADLKERKLWDRYMKAYETIFERCNPKWAPWHIIPADRKWYRNYAVSAVLAGNLKKLGMQYPKRIEGKSN